MPTRNMVDIGGRRLAFTSGGWGRPTVVFESGIECDSASLAALAHAVQRFTHTVSYDRAGLGQSDAAPRPRTAGHAAGDLAALLRATREPAPYVLVAHSYGGLIARLFAQTHRHEVAGMVLLDVPHPALPLRELQHLPAPAPGEPAALAAFRAQAQAAWNDPHSNSEGIDIAASAALFAPNEHYGAMPLIVITAGKDTWDAGFPAELAQAQEADWMRAQQELLLYSTNSRQIIATESDHSIQDCQPELVIDVVHALIERLRS